MKDGFFLALFRGTLCERTRKACRARIKELLRNAENDMPDYDYGWDAAIKKVLEIIKE